LANAAGLGPRQFSRAFRNATGASPAKAIESLRLEAAQLMIVQSRHPVEVVARETGFGDQERMRRAFVRVLGQSLQPMRRGAVAERAEHVRMAENLGATVCAGCAPEGRCRRLTRGHEPATWPFSGRPGG
jgi:AraC-like DNA-binding protein